MNLITGTTYLRPDEPAINLAEVNLVAPKNDGTDDTDWYRFQIIHVWRDGELTEFRDRMGLARDFTASQLRVMGGCEIDGKLYIEETVGSLKEYATDMRSEPPLTMRDFTELEKAQESMLRTNRKYY